MRQKFLRFRKHASAAQQKQLHVLKRAAHHPAFFVPVFTMSLLLFFSVAVILVLSGGKPSFSTSDTHVVIVTHDGVEQTIPTRATTVAELLSRNGIAVGEGDVVEPDTATPIVSDNFRVNVYRAVPVTIVDGNKKTFAFSAAKTPRSIVKQAGIEVFPEDTLAQLPVDNFLIEGSIGERVVITRATAVNLNLYGTQLNLRTQAKTVEGLLQEKNVKLSQGDTVQPSLKSALTTNEQVFVLRKGIKIEAAQEDIPMPRTVIEDDNLSFGTIVTRQQGSPGKKLVTYQIDTNTGERKKIQEVTIVDAVAQVTARGKAVQIPADKQAVMAAAGIPSSDFPYVDFVVSHESGWCPTKLQGQVGYCPPYAPETLPSSKGYGLGQATPGTKMSSFGSDWKTSAVTQLKWATSYAKDRYGGWSGAYYFWQSHHYW